MEEKSMLKTTKRRAKSLLAALLCVALFLAGGVGTAWAAETVGIAETVTLSLSSTHVLAVKSDGSLWAWGDNGKGQLGDGTTENRFSPVKIMEDVVSVAAGDLHSAAIKKDGSLWTWGFNGLGQLGDGTSEDRLAPVKIMAAGVQQVDAGSVNTFVIKEDGSLWGCGSNFCGQLLTGRYGGHAAMRGGKAFDEGIDQNVFVKVMDDVRFVDTQNELVDIIKTDNTLWTWGGGKNTLLGNGTAGGSREPVKIMDNVAATSVGNGYAVAVKQDGTLWAWGDNSKGQLGDGTTEDRLLPTKIMDGVKIACADTYEGICTFAIKTDNSLWSWGHYSVFNKLGFKTERIVSPTEAAKKIFPPTSVMDKVADMGGVGLSSVVALDLDGTIWAWGHSYGGELGAGLQVKIAEEPIKIMDETMLPTVIKSVAHPTSNEPSNWAKAEVDEALTLGIVSNSHDITNSWQSKTKRSDAAIVLGQAIEQATGKPLSIIAEEHGWDLFDHSADFADVAADGSPGSYETIFLKHAGVVAGVGDNRYNPNGTYTRAQAVTMIGRAAEVFFGKQMSGGNPFGDVPDWAASYVGYAADAGIASGVGGGKLDSDSPLTNEQLAIFALRAYKAWK
ncbi:MAG: S-layer homology domain-containing protein [Clostridiales bacterium]|nr:S-layer homology domain-containing protein [Clostridiales bacterium]